MSMAMGPINPLNPRGYSFRQFFGSLFPDPGERHDRSRWSQSATRRLRYRYLWSFYDQTIYSGLFSEIFKREMGLGKNIRPVFNQITRLVELHVTHLMGGQLDRDAGDGKMTPTALPIILGKKGDQSIPEVVAGLWKASNWQVKKSLFTRYGAALGDTGLELVDDPKKGVIRLRVVDPGEVDRATFDAYGNVTSAVIERFELDPDDSDGERMAVYKETVSLDDDGVVRYRTEKDGSPYPWPGTAADQYGEWESPFPFVPLLLNQHIDQGFPWGIAEVSGALYKTAERDNQGSSLADGAIKMVNGPWFLKGAELSNKSARSNPWDGDPFGPQNPNGASIFEIRSAQISARADMPIIQCLSKDAAITPLVYPLPVADVLSFCEKLGEAMERDYPELQADLKTSSGDASGRALRVAREKGASKFEERRISYDGTLARAHRMAFVMGGILGYPGYEAFASTIDLDDPKLDHHIGARAVYSADPLDTLEIQTARAAAITGYVTAGFTLESALNQLDFQPDDIDDIVSMAEAEAERNRQRAKADRDKMLAAQAAATAAATGDATSTPPAPPPGGDPAATIDPES